MPANRMSITKVSAVPVGAALLALFIAMNDPTGNGAFAAASDVRLAAVACAGNPEVVEVKNFGDEGQDLTGWQLHSDGDAPFSLTQAGIIPAGGSIFIESGPNAQSAFRWSQSEIFRENDTSDFARLVDNTGATRAQTACAQAAASPTATPTPEPAVGGVPNGGGLPGPSDSVLTPAMFIYAGGSIIGAVVGLSLAWMGVSLGLDRRRKRRGTATGTESAEDRGAPAVPAALAIAAPANGMRVRRAEVATPPLLLALIVALVAAILVALLMPSADSTGRR
ncbi:MAG TPA: lamin tail domain-containing protein [Dehalococcoidia bacterium]|nr:lamin tail domain-containing protein [Dehalococcoidia bacterium]